jgi:hypothetical protein
MAKNFKGIVFLATPHRGAELAGLLSNLLTVTFAQPLFVDQLREHCETVTEINSAFIDRAAELHLVCFYESTGTSLGVHQLSSSTNG